MIESENDDYAERFIRRGLRPEDVRCTDCEGIGAHLGGTVSAVSDFTLNPCMQCVGTGLTPISSAEVIKGRGTL